MDCINNIKNNINLRESLIEMKTMMSKGLSAPKDHELIFKLKELLKHEDPKVRKNTAIIIGQLTESVELLLDSYHHEETDYVKEAYLKGISYQPVQPYIKDLKQIQEDLMHNENANTKHVQSQLKILNPLILQNVSHKKKMIKFYHEPIDVVLTTLPYYQFVAFEHVLHLKYKPVSQGVLVRTESLYDLQKIRVYKDMLIPIGASLLNISLSAIEEGIKKSQLLSILDKLYDDPSVIYYRVVDGMREKNTQLVKQVSQKIFELYPQRLLNVETDYDIQLTLKEVKKGTINIYIQLSHLDNPRFDYRKYVIPTSMNPYVAATLVQLAKPYMKYHGKVLDPFAGVGTLLIEKNKEVPSHFAMGVDIYNDGIEKARKNTSLANQTIYYVHKDALRFSHNEMFDEIITDMPTFAQMKDENALRELYDKFFARIPHLVKAGGYVFLYTSEISLVRKNLRLMEGYLSLEEHYDIPRGKNMFYFFIIKVK